MTKTWRNLWISLVVLLLLTIASAIFVYQVSPLRDPAFQPNSANGGTLIPWLQGVKERDWIRAATVLAALLATNINVLLWQYSQGRRLFMAQGAPRRSPQSRFILLVIAFLGVGVVIFGALWVLFLSYLLMQWLVD